MPLTLAEAAKQTQDPIASSIIEIFARTSPVMASIPIMTIQSGAYPYNLEGSLPGVAFRGINEGYTPSTGVVNPQIESLKIVGGMVDVDDALEDFSGRTPGDLRSSQTARKVKALSRYATKMFFKGDSSVDGRQYDGLQVRIPSGSSQLIPVKDSGAADGGDDLTLDKLDELLDAVDGADFLFMNKRLRRKVSALVRAAGQAMEVVNDQFGRQLQAYAGVPIGIIETDEAGAPILGFNEVGPGGSTATCASIYAVKFGVDEYVAMLQSKRGMIINDIGIVDSEPTKARTLIEWRVSPVIFNGKGVARLWGIKQPAA
jgi:hypothetical protein